MERCVPLTKAFFLFQCLQKGICKAYGEYNKYRNESKK